jgi:inner membrane protease subunit 1
MASFHFARHPVRTTVSFIKAACLVHLGLTYGYTISPAQGPSMLPTFTVDGDWILCDHTRRYGRGVSVGDLVVYRIPIFNSQWGVKRVTGMPGDYVSVGTPGEPGEELMIQVIIPVLTVDDTNSSDSRRPLLDCRG